MEFKKLTTLSIILCFFVTSFSQKRNSRKEYIALWKNVAIREMVNYGIPASITLAQAILESGDGNSKLARKGNNHFGIKCHEWKGKKIFIDDDKKNECFRKYKDAAESFKDHSQFLAERKRYSDLFKLKITDYKAWAKGLKKAGYATNPKYPKLLIKLIEENNLHAFDEIGLKKINNEPDSQFEENNQPNALTNETLEVRKVKLGKYEGFSNPNKSTFIIAKEGDTYSSICEKFDLEPWQLYEYNDVKKGYQPKVGEYIYVKPKKNKAKTPFHIVEKGQTIWSIAQLYGIKLRKLKQYNTLKKKERISVGMHIKLSAPKK